MDASYQGKDDPRYPSPRLVRQVFAFAIDLAVTLGSAVGAFFLCKHVHQHFIATYLGLDALVALIVVSFVHRTVIQWVFRTTLGKALFGLVVIRREDGGRPTLWKLIKVWFVGVWYGVSAAADTVGNSATGTDYKSSAFLPAVRFRDVRALRRARRMPAAVQPPPRSGW